MQASQWAESDRGLTRELHFPDFATAFSFMTAVAEVAEEMNHHPDWCNSWNRVSLSLVSHDVGRVTERDRRLADAIDAIVVRFAQSTEGQ